MNGKKLWIVSTLLCLVLAVPGANLATGGSQPKEKDPGKSHDHGTGPHGGVLLDWGKYLLEFTVDHTRQEATVYVLGEDGRNAVAIRAEKLMLRIREPKFEVELKPVPSTDDPSGTSSRFVGKHEKFGKEREFAGTILGVVDGRPHAGNFDERLEHSTKKNKE